MREIKFRAWDKEGSAMICPETKNNIGSSLKFVLDAWGDSENERVFIMQFIGLKDRNGKEIYEGDVVRFNTHNAEFGDVVSIIGFKDGCFGWATDEKFVPFYRADYFQPENDLEVIGNIYENPELIEEENN